MKKFVNYFLRPQVIPTRPSSLTSGTRPTDWETLVLSKLNSNYSDDQTTFLLLYNTSTWHNYTCSTGCGFRPPSKWTWKRPYSYRNVQSLQVRTVSTACPVEPTRCVSITWLHNKPPECSILNCQTLNCQPTVQCVCTRFETGQVMIPFLPHMVWFDIGSALIGGGRTERYLGRTKGQVLRLALKKIEDLQTGDLACIYYGLHSTHRNKNRWHPASTVNQCPKPREVIHRLDEILEPRTL
jgi:hypothetical protein